MCQELKGACKRGVISYLDFSSKQTGPAISQRRPALCFLWPFITAYHLRDARTRKARNDKEMHSVDKEG